MKKRIMTAAIVFALSIPVFGCADKRDLSGTLLETTPALNEEESSVQSQSSIALSTDSEINKAKERVWNEYLEYIRNDETRVNEIRNRKITYNDITMKFGMQKIGSPDENGKYPLYIALHGGGQDETGEINESQWLQMSSYYKKSVLDGIYVNPRGIRDTWDCHANPESFWFYDRLIEDLIALENVDPNKVYILGFSAGGDGVYMITPKMTDRFAGANMSAGHPNGISLKNLYNMPIMLQVGLFDTAYGRNTVTAEYDALLSSYAKEYGGGYIHKVNIHALYAHNFYDNKFTYQEVIKDNAAWLETGDTETEMRDTNAVIFLEKLVRNPLPDKIVWELKERAALRETDANYWLCVPKEYTEGIIVASFDKTSNTVTFDEMPEHIKLQILVSNTMFDIFSPVTVVMPDGTKISETVTPSYDTIVETTYDRGDLNYQFAGKIDIER